MRRYFFKVLVLCLTSIFSFRTAYSDSMRFFYGDYEFLVPKGFSVLLSTNEEDNAVIMKYGGKGEGKYIGISTDTDEYKETFGSECKFRSFYKDAFEGTRLSRCKERDVEVLRYFHGEPSSVTKWDGIDGTFYFSSGKDLRGKAMSYLFFVRPDDFSMQIQSDFLTAKQMKAMIQKHLPAPSSASQTNGDT